MSGDHSHGHDHEHAESPDVEAARRVLDEHTKTRMQACADEVEQVLKRHGFRLEISPASIVLAAE